MPGTAESLLFHRRRPLLSGPIAPLSGHCQWAMEGHPEFPMAMTEAEVEAVVREVTDEEVAH